MGQPKNKSSSLSLPVRGGRKRREIPQMVAIISKPYNFFGLKIGKMYQNTQKIRQKSEIRDTNPNQSYFVSNTYNFLNIQPKPVYYNN